MAKQLMLVWVTVVACALSACTSGKPTGLASNNGAASSTTASQTAPRPAGDPQLNNLYTAVFASCYSNSQDCNSSNVGGATWYPLSAFCKRLITDAAPMLDAAGLSDSVKADVAEEMRADVQASGVVQGGVLAPNGANSAGCVTPAGPEQFGVFISTAPPANLNSFEARPLNLNLGKGCATLTKPAQAGWPGGFAFACLTNNLWAFDISEVGAVSIPTPILEQQYRLLAADLASPAVHTETQGQ